MSVENSRKESWRLSSKNACAIPSIYPVPRQEEERSGIPMPRAAPKQPNQLNFDQVDQVIEGGAHPKIPPGGSDGGVAGGWRSTPAPASDPKIARAGSEVWRRYTRAKPGTDRHAERTPGLAQGGSSCEKSLGCLKVDLTAGRARMRGG